MPGLLARALGLGGDGEEARAHSLWLDLGGALALGAVAFVTLLPLHLHLPVLRGEVGFQGDEGTELYNSDLLRRGWTLYTEAWDFNGPVG